MKTYQIKHKLLFFILTLVIFFSMPVLLRAQRLSELYKNDKVILEEVDDYANKNNWEQLFFDADKMEFNKKTGLSKGIVVMPDGTVFMCHQTRYEISKFDKNGSFVKKFGAKGSKPGQFSFHFDLNSTFDGKYIFTSDNQGSLSFFDTEGNYIKKLKINFMPLEIVSLKDSKIAILGFVVGKTNKYIIVLKDIISGKENTIWSRIDDNTEKSSLTVKYPGKGTISIAIPYYYSSFTKPSLATSKNGTLFIGFSDSGKIDEYSPAGLKLNSFSLGMTPLAITDNDIDKKIELIRKKFDELLKESNSNPGFSTQEKKETADQVYKQLNSLKDRSLYASHFPYFSSLIMDSDGNVLVFEFTKDKETNKFKAYAFDASGKEIGSSSFVSNSYDLSFVPSTFSFRNGYIYAVAIKNNGGKIPLRLVKFRCAGK